MFYIVNIKAIVSSFIKSMLSQVVQPIAYKRLNLPDYTQRALPTL